MARNKKTESKRPIESYEHRDKERVNNPPVGLVTPQTDPDAGQKKTYAYDPHLDPQLVWAGKAEHTSFEVPTVSLHVHERIDPRTIIEAVRKKNGGGPQQMTLFDTERAEPLRHAVEFYQHAHGWSNRLVAGDSLLVMNSLLEKEGLAGKVQMIYIDPPYGIKYGSNFQPFVNKRDVKDGKDEDLTSEPEQIRAFRDTWELGIHSYLTYLRDRLLLARELLAESGSCFVQISDENVHHVRELMDEVFGAGNFVSQIAFRTTAARAGGLLDNISDYALWYAKDKSRAKYRQLFVHRPLETESNYDWIESEGACRQLTEVERWTPEEKLQGKKYALADLTSQGYTESGAFQFEYGGQTFAPNAGRHWSTTESGMKNLAAAGRLQIKGQNVFYRRFLVDYLVRAIPNSWDDTAAGGFLKGESKIYVVQTNTLVIQRCLLMTTDPGDLVFDPTCVRKGTRVWCVEDGGGCPPMVPPHAGGRPCPCPEWSPCPDGPPARGGTPPPRLRGGLGRGYPAPHRIHPTRRLGSGA
ncbi:DNA methyltransferase [Thermochromatium tepidum]|uniref:DNA methyltransferase n=1 Tax=Thermochromatium tepidum TaxID=1050 RepID=UPI001B85E950|nr:DNA methyltransferase [Thermochromatium tepidum]